MYMQFNNFPVTTFHRFSAESSQGQATPREQVNSKLPERMPPEMGREEAKKCRGREWGTKKNRVTLPENKNLPTRDDFFPHSPGLGLNWSWCWLLLLLLLMLQQKQQQQPIQTLMAHRREDFFLFTYNPTVLPIPISSKKCARNRTNRRRTVQCIGWNVGQKREISIWCTFVKLVTRGYTVSPCWGRCVWFPVSLFFVEFFLSTYTSRNGRYASYAT